MDGLLEELHQAARAVVQAARELCDDVEVTIWRSDSTAYEIHNRELAPDVALGRVQTGLRVLRGGKMAMAATSSLDVGANLAAVKAALNGLRPSALTGFAPGDAPDAPWTWAGGLAPLGTEATLLRGLAADLKARAFAAPGAEKRLESLEGAVVYQERRTAQASRGGSGAWRGNGLFAYASVNSAHSRSLWLGQGEIDAAGVSALGAQALAELPDRLVEPQELAGGGEIEAILHPALVDGILRAAAQEKFSGQAARNGLSRLAPGDRIFGEALTLWDAPTTPGLSSSAPFDDERTPTRKIPLALAGRFQGLLYTRETALLAGAAATASGWRYPVMTEDTAEAPIRERFGALVMEPGARSKDQLVSGLERGVVLFGLLGLHGADKSRAAFSTAVDDGFAVENGKVIGRLAPGRWNVSGRALPSEEGPGIFADAEPSRERIATGRALLPWVRCRVQVG